MIADKSPPTTWFIGGSVSQIQRKPVDPQATHKPTIGSQSGVANPSLVPQGTDQCLPRGLAWIIQPFQLTGIVFSVVLVVRTYHSVANRTSCSTSHGQMTAHLQCFLDRQLHSKPIEWILLHSANPQVLSISRYFICRINA